MAILKVYKVIQEGESLTIHLGTMSKLLESVIAIQYLRVKTAITRTPMNP